jgi:RNA polymerase sigma-70 factor (ECF subfamily)
MAKAGSTSPDEVLVVAAILGDFGAFNELAGRYRAAVVRLAQGIVGQAFAEDVAQDALLLAFKALPSIDDPARFAAWLMAVTRNRALRFGKKEQARARRSVELDALLLENLDALSGPPVDTRDTAEEVRKALEQMPAEYALVVRLRFFDEVPLERIGAFLDVPVSTVKWRVHRGKQLLRKELERLSRQPWTEKS